MAVVRNLMIRAGADFSAITKQASKASQSMRGMQQSVSRSCGAMSKAAAGLKKAFMAVGVAVSAKAIIDFARDAAQAYDQQVEGEVKLAQVMRNTMGARNEEIQSILDLTSAQQQLGVVGDEVQLAGAQELATYLSLTSSLETLIPVMNDMAVQQYGYNVTAEETTSIATMLGKVMEGQTGALSRYGYYFDEAQEAILKFGTESQRAATLAQVVTQSVGGMNQALAATPTGRMKQLSNALSDVKENFGQAVRSLSVLFIPLLNKLAGLLAAIATFLNRVAQSFVNVFGNGARAAGKEWQFIPASTVSAIDDAADATDHLTDSTNQAAQAAKKAKQAFQQAGFDTLNILKEDAQEESSPSSSYTPSSPSSSPTTTDDYFKEIATEGEAGEALEGFPKLEQFLTKIKDTVEKLKETWDKLKEKLSEVKEKISEIIDKIKEKIKEIVENVRENGSKVLYIIDAIVGSAALIDWLIGMANAAAIAGGAIGELAAGLGAAGLLGAASAVMGTVSEFAFMLEGVAVPALTACATAVGETAAVLGVAGFIGAISGASAAAEGFIGLVGGGVVGALGAASTAALNFGGALGLAGTSAGIGIGGGGLIAALGAGGAAMGLFGTSITGVAVPALTAGTGATAAAAGGAAALAAPVAAIVAIVAALGVATYEVIKHWDQLKEVAGRAVDGMKTAWKGVGEWWKTSVSDLIIEWGKKTWDEVKSGASQAADKIKEVWNGVRTTLSGIWDGVKSTAVNVWNSIKDAGKTAWDTIYSGAMRAWDTAKSGAATAWETVKSTWGAAGNYFDSNVFQPLINAVKTGIDKVKDVFSGLSSVADSVVQKVKNAIANLQSSVPSLNTVKSSIQSAFSTIASKASSVINTVANAVGIGSKTTTTTRTVPHLAAGAVIPPNREFAAVLGDQRSGMNLETPERLLREVVREESGNAAVLMMLDDILSAVREGKEITLDGYRLGKTMQRTMAMNARAAGIA